MKTNESTTDRIARLIIGLIFGYIGYISMPISPALAYVGYIIGVILIATAITGFCLLYKLIGISTKKEMSAQQISQPLQSPAPQPNHPASQTQTPQPPQQPPQSPQWPTT